MMIDHVKFFLDAANMLPIGSCIVQQRRKIYKHLTYVNMIVIISA
jgi:hypothetical protein